MSNLSDLLPAGAAAKQLTFTDSGSGISSKAPVILNSDGTVSGISNTSASGGTAVNFEAGTTMYPAIVYDSANNKMVIFYEDQDNSRYGTAIVGTVSGTSISYGTPVIFNSGTTTFINATYDPDTSQTVTVYKDESNSNYGTAIVGSVSGTSISFGSEAVYASVNVYYNNVTYDTTNNKVVIAYMDVPASQYGKALIGTVSGTSISYGSATTFESGSTNYIGICYDSSNDRTVISYQDADDTNKGKAVVGTTSGTSISVGTAVTFESGIISESAAAFDTSVNRVLIAYRLSGSGGVAVAGEVSGTSITFGGTVLITSEPLYIMGIAFDANAGKTIIPYNTPSNTAAYRLASISGTTTTLDSEVAFNAPAQPKYPFVAYNSTEKVDVITYYNSADNYGYSTVVQVADVSNLTAEAFVGVADSAISASAAGSVIVQGGTVSGVSEAAALRFGTSSVWESANSSTICETFDSTNNKVVIAYRDLGNSNYATAVVATVSGSSLTYGTPVVFETSDVGELSAAFDSNENRVVISFRDAASTNYGKSIVGEVSGTSISFGTAATFSGTNSAYNTSTAFDSSNNKIVVSYRDTSNSNYGTAVVGTVSGASITFGTPVVYSAAATTNYGSITYDSTSNQIVLCYQSGVDEKAIVGAVSGTSISFGAEATVESSAAPGHRSVAFDSTNNRVVDTYSNGSTGYCTSAIGTVSGTSISFGTPVIADTASTGYLGSAFDVSTGKLVIVYNASSSGLANTGTVSGTTITFDSKVTFLSGDPNHVGAIYDSNANRVVVSYSDSTNSNYGTSIAASSGTSPLTVGTKYYVTTSGTFSSSADSPSVNAGLAISTTSLLLNGDS